jgi:hypothetical protein
LVPLRSRNAACPGLREGDRPEAISGGATDRRILARGARQEEINLRCLGAGDQPEAINRGTTSRRRSRTTGRRHHAVLLEGILAIRGQHAVLAATDPQAVVTTPCCLRGSSPSGGSKPSSPCHQGSAGHRHHTMLLEGVPA